MSEYRLVYDSGSKVLKCAIADELGKIISLEYWEEEVIKSEDGLYREWNHKNYWKNLINLTKITIKSAKIDPKKIKYITLTILRENSRKVQANHFMKVRVIFPLFFLYLLVLSILRKKEKATIELDE